MAHLLVVDDRADNRYLLRVLLEGHGHTVDEAAHGEAALAAAHATPPDAVITDLLMPGMDGYSLLRAWKDDPRLAGIPVIVYTATYTEPRDERLAVALGAEKFLIKPAEPAVLVAAVEDALAAAREGRLRPAGDRPDEQVLLREYNAILIRKLEQKAEQLEVANRKLREEIDEHARAAAEVARTSQLLRAVADSTTDAIFVKGLDGRYLLFNEAAARAVGKPVAEVLGRDDRALFPPEDAAVVMAHDARVRATGEVVVEDEHLMTPQGRRTFLALKAPYRDAEGRIIGTVGISRDITDRLAVDEALRLRDRAIQHVAQGILITDITRPDHPIIFASAGFTRMTGYTEAEVLGRNCRLLQGPATDPEAVRRMREAIAAGRSVRVELLNYRRDGSTFWNALTLDPVVGADGRVAQYVGVLADVTERRQLEEQLRQAQKMEAVGRLAGGIAHDFNNLLTVISGYSDQLAREPRLEPDDREAAQEIRAAAERAAALTRQLLSFSRQTVLQPRLVDVNALVARSAQLLRRLIGEDITLVTAPDPSCRPVRVDPGQFDQVLMNLAVNARDAMPAGGTLTIATGEVRRDGPDPAARLDPGPGEYVRLTITDTGHGMTPEVLARLFEPFFTTKEQGRGTGLGLATVFGIVQQSEGGIAVESAPEMGTTFRIDLPVAAGAAHRASDPVTGVGPDGSETILLVEDDDAVRTLATTALASHGYAVLPARDGPEAIRVATATDGRIDIVVTDLVLPSQSGPQLLEALRALRPGLRGLVMSGYSDDAATRAGFVHGALPFIQKPFTPRALAKRVRQVLDGDGDD